ncbi:MAG: hypothetical protein J7K04_07610 [Spirochaetales bacterium]|nr:hypothetical protein [Spirochaetales bacterium]
MGKVILVTDTDTPVGYELAKRYTQSGISLIAAADSETVIESFSGLSKETYLQVKWSRKSPISARNVVLSGLNYFKHIDEAVIIQSFQGQDIKNNNGNFGNTKFTEIESIIDAEVKGNLFLIKELIHNLPELPLTVVQYSKSGISDISPLEALVINGFENFIKSLAGHNRETVINGFFAAEVPATEYADYIVKTIKDKIDKSRGRIFRYSLRQGIFIRKH